MRNARLSTLVARPIGAATLLGLAWLAAAFTGGALPANTGWRAPARGVTIYVESNPIHTGLVMPKVAAGVDWRRWARPEDLADPRYARFDHVAIGWGQKDFYLGTPTWREVKPRVILAALIGSDATLMHVEHLPRPAPGPDERSVTLTPEQYRRLAAFIIASFRPGGRRYPGYGAGDAFYDARGHYDAFRTCNSWTGDALRRAGVRVGRWTPLPATVAGWF